MVKIIETEDNFLMSPKNDFAFLWWEVGLKSCLSVYDTFGLSLPFGIMLPQVHFWQQKCTKLLGQSGKNGKPYSIYCEHKWCAMNRINKLLQGSLSRTSEKRLMRLDQKVWDRGIMSEYAVCKMVSISGL